mgnify:CR=1 FL=1
MILPGLTIKVQMCLYRQSDSPSITEGLFFIR